MLDKLFAFALVDHVYEVISESEDGTCKVVGDVSGVAAVTGRGYGRVSLDFLPDDPTTLPPY